MKKKSTTRAKQLFPIILIGVLYFGWLGVPYIADCVEQNVQTIRGEVIEINERTYKGRHTSYTYTIESSDGTTIDVKVDERRIDGREMEEARCTK